MSYESQMRVLEKYAPAAASRLVEENSELFLSVDEKAAMEAVASTMRLRWEEIPTPNSEDDMLAVLSVILGDLLREAKIKIAPFGLSALGREEWSALVNPPTPSTKPADVYRQVIELYKTNVNEFNRLRSDSDFRRASDEANQLGLLR